MIFGRRESGPARKTSVRLALGIWHCFFPSGVVKLRVPHDDRGRSV